VKIQISHSHKIAGKITILHVFNTYILSIKSWGDPEVDRRIILRGIFRKWEGVVETGWSGLRIGTGGGHL
jgi:hypothetical protein